MNYTRAFFLGLFAATMCAVGAATAAHAETDAPSGATSRAVRYRTVQVDGIDMFYREAGPPNAPAILLLHGFPTSSHMFRTLIPLLANSYHVIAPDYPGFGFSSSPNRDRFAYTFENLTRIVDRFVTQVGLSRYTLYVMDYGAPIGFRLALLHPERLSGFIVQNGNAYEEGLTDFWKPIKAYWTQPTQANRDALRAFLKPDSTKWQYTNGVADASLLSPDTWTLDQIGLDRPGNAEIQLDLFYDYRRNVELYPKIQEYFRTHQPPVLLVWGKNDVIFPVAGAYPYKRDLPQADIHLLDSGHFALETHAGPIADLIQRFLQKQISRK